MPVIRLACVDQASPSQLLIDLRIHQMFVLRPDGKGSGNSSTNSPLKENIKFWGKLGLYFVAVRVAYVFFGHSKGSQKQITSK